MASRRGSATLVGHVFAALLAVSVTAASITTLASALLHQSTIMEEARVELGTECEVVASTLDASDDEIPELESIELGEMRATLVDEDGAVLYDSIVEPNALARHETRPEIADALRDGEGWSVRASTTVGYMAIYQARRLRSGHVVRLSVDRAGVFSILLGDLGILAGVLAALVAMTYVVARLLSARLVKPILEIDVRDLDAVAPYEELQPLTDRLAEQQYELFAQMEDLRSAEAMRREFTANVTHELKTPIASIMGASELIRDGFVLDEDIPGFAARINSESQRLSALVNDILTLSRLDESERSHSSEPFGAPEPVDLCAVARDVTDRMASRADNAEVTLEVMGVPTLVSGYPRIVDELVANLCSNAIRYNRPGGEVRLWVGERGGRPTVEVADTGIGIPEEAQPKVFERFYRVETSRSRASGGTGLGLAIVKHAAALHGAEVELTSALGKGTTVVVSFPPSPRGGTDA